MGIEDIRPFLLMTNGGEYFSLFIFFFAFPDISFILELTVVYMIHGLHLDFFLMLIANFNSVVLMDLIASAVVSF